MLEVFGVNKSYGRRVALTDISFTVPEGEVVGLLGSNGAGKSSLLRILAGFLAPSGGLVRLHGLSMIDDPVAYRRGIGYMPEDTPLYRDMRVKSYLWYRGRIKGMTSRRLRRRIRELLAVCGIESVAERLIGGLSRGYRQRLGLADALLGAPGLVVLDEPLANLDPNQRRQMRETVRNLSGRHTVLLSSHILPDVESICSRLFILHQGRLVLQGESSELRRATSVVVRLRLELLPPPSAPSGETGADAWCAGLAVVSRQERLDDGWVRLEVEARPDAGDIRSELFDRVVKAGCRIREMHVPETGLEDVFASVTGLPAELE